MSYPTLAEVKTYIGANESKDDGFLSSLAPEVVSYIEGKAGADRRFAVTADTTHYFDARADVSSDAQRLRLDDDLCSITSVTNGDGMVLTTADYITEPRNSTPYYGLRLKLNTTAPIWQWETSPQDAIVIVGKWGYSTTPPEDIRLAYLMLMAYFYRRRSNSGDSDRAVAAEGIVIMPATVPKDIQAILMSYRRRALS